MQVKHHLWDYLDEHRAEILAEAIEVQRRSAPGRSDEELLAGLDGFYTELVAALRRAGRGEEPAPISRDEATRLGSERRQRGFEISQVGGAFGSISAAMGTVGQRTGEAFAAVEYRHFNECIDAGVASAIQRYYDEADEGGREYVAKRVGYLIHEIRNATQAARMAYAVISSGTVGLQSHTGRVLGRNLGRIESLVTQGVALVRVDAQVPTQIKTVQLARVLEDLVASAALERDITIRVSVDPSLSAQADEQLLVSAVSNLLQNALKFTRTGSEVELRASADDVWVHIEVEDECGGLPAGAAQEVWEPFVRKTADQRGMGLGLSITRDAVLAQHGQVDVRDLPGKGCVFSIALPRG